MLIRMRCGVQVTGKRSSRVLVRGQTFDSGQRIGGELLVDQLAPDWYDHVDGEGHVIPRPDPAPAAETDAPTDEGEGE